MDYRAMLGNLFQRRQQGMLGSQAGAPNTGYDFSGSQPVQRQMSPLPAYDFSGSQPQRFAMSPNPVEETPAPFDYKSLLNGAVALDQYNDQNMDSGVQHTPLSHLRYGRQGPIQMRFFNAR